VAKLLTRWVLTAVPMVFGVSVLTFVLVSLVPGDAARTILGPTATADQIRQLRHQLHLDQPLWSQYWHWLDGVLHGNWGTSVQSGGSVAAELTSRLPVTLSLILGAALVSVLLGIGLGLGGALRPGLLGKVIDVFSLAGLAVPGYWLGLVLVTLLAVRVPLFPAIGYVPFGDDPLKWFESLALPVATLGFGSSAPIARQTRDSVLHELDREYVRVLRARGISERSIILRHVMRNAGTPILSVCGLVVVTLTGVAVLVETVFVLPGLGGLAVTATATHDIPVIQAVAVVLTVLVVTVNLAIEIGYGALNPKVRTS
jgi:peptide/nickel transport system permease protein